MFLSDNNNYKLTFEYRISNEPTGVVGRPSFRSEVFSFMPLDTSGNWVIFEIELNDAVDAGGNALGFTVVSVGTGGAITGTFEFRNLILKRSRVENEFDFRNVCDNGICPDTADIGNKLVATNNDKITYNTKPLLQDKLFGAGAPKFAPDAIGQEYYDTVGKVKYSAFGTASSADWILQ